MAEEGGVIIHQKFDCAIVVQLLCNYAGRNFEFYKNEMRGKNKHENPDRFYCGLEEIAATFLGKKLVKHPALRLDNRPHQFVKYLSKNHEVTVLCINDWWKGGQDNPEGYRSDFDDVFERIEVLNLTEKKVSLILQELFSAKMGESGSEWGF